MTGIPATYLPGVGDRAVLGVEAALWTETVTDMDDIEYLAFPRLAVIAEIGWSPAGTHDWSTVPPAARRPGTAVDAAGDRLLPVPAGALGRRTHVRSQRRLIRRRGPIGADGTSRAPRPRRARRRCR